MFRARQYLIFLFLVAFLASLLLRLFYLQVVSFERFSEMAFDQHNRVIEIEPRRGAIFDRYLEPLAINLDTPSIYCDPRSIKDKEHTAEIVSGVLGVDKESLVRKLHKDKAFVWVKRKVDKEDAARLKQMNLEGVHSITESKRKYPNDNMASHVMGFVSVDNDGLEGLEVLFDEKLKGKSGWRHLIRDARMRTVLFNEKDSIPAENGHNLILTIDGVVQYIAEEELKKMVRKYNASNGTVIIMEPSTGRILAMANYPDYNLNYFSETPKELMKNAAASNVYEPGSVFKVVTAGAALEEDVIPLDEKVYCENGEYRVGGRVLHDYHAYGKLTFSKVISKSSNIGTVKVAQRLGEDTLYDYVTRFGFGRKTGIDLPGEVAGISRPPSIWSRSDITTIPIGQGIAVTPLQLACAISVIANGGELMKPYIVEKITTWDGTVEESFRPVVKGRVLSEETCEELKVPLSEVIKSGTGRRARSKKYTACGKTGTAQMVNPNGGYYPDKYYATFIGFAPAENPMISVVVIAKDPHPAHFGGTVAGPTFKNITERTLQYLGAERADKLTKRFSEVN